MKKTIFTIIITFALFCSAQIFAGAFNVTPISIELNKAYPVATIRLTNYASSPLLIQASTKKSILDKNKDVQEINNNDLLVTPQIISIQPYTVGIVRVGLRTPLTKAPTTELAYRLYFKEVPILKKTKEPGVTFIFSISMPAYIAPNVKTKNLTWSTHKIDNNNLNLQISNNSSVHVKIRNIALSDSSSSKLSKLLEEKDIIIPLLSGQTKNLTFKSNHALTKNQVKINATIDWDQATDMGLPQSNTDEVETVNIISPLD
jgi:P pilus assembly chaperone PapD